MALTAAHRTRRSDLLWAWGLRIGTLAAFAALWQLSTAGLQSLLIPTFTQTMAGLYHLAVIDGRLWDALLVSNQALVLGYLVSVIVGVPVGLAMARSRRVESIADPYISILLAVPTAPLMPIIMIAMGLDLASRVMVVILFSIVFITVNTRAGIRNVDRALIEMAESFGATERQVWQKVLIPGSMPVMLAGLRIALGRAVTGMITVELLLNAVGVGKLMLEFRGFYKGDLLFATVLAVVLESIILMAAMRVLERRLVPWGNAAAID